MKTNIGAAIHQLADSTKRIALLIGNRPELGLEEHYALTLLSKALEQSGFDIKYKVLGIPTAFIAEYRSQKSGPIVAFICEYDALPELGHACGHHLICSMGITAAIGLKSVIDQIGGTIRVYGTPAEETCGAKVPMADAGLFDDVDFVLMAHPYHTFEASGTSLAMNELRFEYFGKSAHAAAHPYEGINALDAVILLFNSINFLRQQLHNDVRIHGIITDGGKAPNIIPEKAAARFYIRAATRQRTNETMDKVRLCAEGAALQTGCQLVISSEEYAYDEMQTNETLSEVFQSNLMEMGINSTQIKEGKDHGSVDLGNVSLRCPAIHPYVQVIDEHYLLHTIEFRDSAMSERALDGMIFAAKALAYTAYDVITQPNKLIAIKQEFLSKTSL